MVVDLNAETVDVAATEALRSRMRAEPRRGERRDSSPATVDRRGDGARRGPREPSPAVASHTSPSSVEDLVAQLNERLGGDWSFDVQRHHRNGGGIEVTAELKSNGTRVQRTGTSNGNGTLPLGAQIEIASEVAFRSCAVEMLAVANRG